MPSNIIKMDVDEIVDNKIEVITDTNILFYYNELSLDNIILLKKLGLIR